MSSSSAWLQHFYMRDPKPPAWVSANMMCLVHRGKRALLNISNGCRVTVSRGASAGAERQQWGLLAQLRAGLDSAHVLVLLSLLSLVDLLGTDFKKSPWVDKSLKSN